ncbi:hypothetical protein [Paracoccus litorisediminis]|uniref:Uncharacterized protein n=1 Tax=Paracoccus litorisediminis TaxID=2006130 RepID=A0A844HML1_9RHOB|nr:hypothetical protein [Paracoccus litorisediminis]MTH61106.1 hypothetical protein [Paracoccus litorisediminis]
MTELYTIRFTTKKLVNKFDAKGKKIISQTALETPITMHMLPHATAMSYSGCDNFQIEKYVSQERHSSKGAGRPKGVGNGHKDRFASVGTGHKEGRELAAKAAKPSANPSIVNAAASGNLAAALNR